MAKETNGGGQGKPLKQSTVVLTLDRENFTLQIGGHTENYDEALAIVQFAARELEAKMRAARAGQLLNVDGRMPLSFDPRGPRL